MRRALIVLSCCLLACAQELPEDFFEECEDAADYLAKGHETAPLESLLELLADARFPPDELEKLRKRTDKYLVRKQKSKQLPRAIGKLEDALEVLEEWAGQAPEAELLAAIPLWLRLDSSRLDLFERRGPLRHQGRWMWPEERETLAARAAIAEQVRAAHRFAVPLVASTRADPFLQALYGVPEATVVSGFGVAVVSVRHSAAKLERMLRQALRARALSHWFLHGVLAVPEELWPREFVILGSKDDYIRAVHEAHRVGRLAADRVEKCLELSSFYTNDGCVVASGQFEAPTEAMMLFGLHRDPGQPWLRAGHINWLCHTFLGTRGPSVTYTDSIPEPRGGTVDDETLEEWKRMQKLGKAGLAGSRAYLRWLVAHDQEPYLSDCLHDQFGKVRGEQLLVATHVVEWLQETGRFRELWEATTPAQVGSREMRAVAATTADAVGEGLGAFLAPWKRWLLPPELPAQGLLQRLRDGPPAPPVLSPAAAQALAVLDRLRRQSLRPMPRTPLAWDAELSRGCQAHADYLTLHRDQLRAWPDAHEQYPDREGFSPEGSRAGLASLISPGSDSPEEAIGRWMATWFHRLPLLDPGLMRIGWGLSDAAGVLDTGTFVAPAERAQVVVWPPRGGRAIPRRFAPELPNPFTGRDQSSWGYPITVQLFWLAVEPECGLRLFRGDGVSPSREVACLFSSPDQPGNPELVPDNAFLLIPEQPLEPETEYTVEFTRPDEEPLVWSFRTGP